MRVPAPRAAARLAAHRQACSRGRAAARSAVSIRPVDSTTGAVRQRRLECEQLSSLRVRAAVPVRSHRRRRSVNARASSSRACAIRAAPARNDSPCAVSCTCASASSRSTSSNRLRSFCSSIRSSSFSFSDASSRSRTCKRAARRRTGRRGRRRLTLGGGVRERDRRPNRGGEEEWVARCSASRAAPNLVVTADSFDQLGPRLRNHPVLLLERALAVRQQRLVQPDLGLEREHLRLLAQQLCPKLEVVRLAHLAFDIRVEAVIATVASVAAVAGVPSMTAVATVAAVAAVSAVAMAVHTVAAVAGVAVAAVTAVG
eukprot:3795687-Prymnesium_polylepis.1